MLNNNLGMYVEEVMNRTSTFYSNSSNFFIEKRNLPTKIIKQLNNDTCIVKLLNKSYVDYFGFINGIHFEIETKEVDNLFNLDIVKNHQKDFLSRMNKSGIMSLLIIYFKNTSNFIMIKYSNFLNIKKKSFTINELEENGGKIIKIKYPGILDLKEEISCFLS